MTLQWLIAYAEQNHACKQALYFLNTCTTLEEAYEKASFWHLLWLITHLHLLAPGESEAWILFRNSWADYHLEHTNPIGVSNSAQEELRLAYPLEMLRKALEEAV